MYSAAESLRRVIEQCQEGGIIKEIMAVQVSDRASQFPYWIRIFRGLIESKVIFDIALSLNLVS